MKLQLNQDTLIKEVQQTSAYAACSDPDHPENYQFVTATDADRPLLQRFFKEALSEICDLIKHSLAEVVHHGTKVFLYLTLSRTNRVPRAALLAALSGYLVNRILSRWFDVVSPDRADSYRTAASGHLTLLRQFLAPSPTPRRISPL